MWNVAIAVIIECLTAYPAYTQNLIHSNQDTTNNNYTWIMSIKAAVEIAVLAILFLSAEPASPFGYYGSDCSQKQVLPRRPIHEYTDKEWNEFIQIVWMSKTYQSDYVVVLEESRPGTILPSSMYSFTTCLCGYIILLLKIPISQAHQVCMYVILSQDSSMSTATHC